MKKSCRGNLPALMFMFALLMLWQLGAMKIHAAYILPTPVQILQKLWELREILFTVHLPATMLVTLVGTALAVVITAMAAYALANKNVRYRSAMSLYFFITMTFSAGIVPWYLMCLNLGLRNNFLALIIPSLLFSPFNMFLVRNYMDGLPASLRESATLDGANDVTIFFKIYMPLSVPSLATVTLFYGLAYWNDWFNAIMLVDDSKMYPLQYLLLQLRSQVQMIRDMQAMMGGAITAAKPPSESLKMATSIITIGPIVLLYPLLQRYFVKGLVVGAVKE